MTGRRALLWSASPMLFLYAFHNEALAVVAASVAGLWCWWRGRPIGAALWSDEGRAVLVTWSVWVRAGTFLILVVAFLRAPPAISRPLDGTEIAGEPALAD